MKLSQLHEVDNLLHAAGWTYGNIDFEAFESLSNRSERLLQVGLPAWTCQLSARISMARVHMMSDNTKKANRPTGHQGWFQFI